MMNASVIQMHNRIHSHKSDKSHSHDVSHMTTHSEIQGAFVIIFQINNRIVPLHGLSMVCPLINIQVNSKTADAAAHTHDLFLFNWIIFSKTIPG